MKATKKVYVTSKLMKLLAFQAEELMDKNPALRKAWLDNVSTSKTSMRNASVIRLDTEWDWAVAFFIWRTGGAAALPRERISDHAIPDHLPWDDRDLYGNS